MPILESLTVKLGASIAKSVLKFWVKDTAIGRDTASEIGRLLGQKLPELRTQRKTRRFFERLAEEIADELQPYFEGSGDHLPENEKLATIHALADTFDRAALEDQILLDLDLSALKLAEYLRRASPDATRDLSSAASELYALALREACNYVIEITATLPDFNAHATRELLDRETETIKLLKTILEQLPQQRTNENPHDAAARFETEYLRQVARRLDQLELFGVSLNRMRPRYSLSIAYISLTTSSSDEGFVSSNIRVEELLSQISRHLIRGEPGSGKTTLMQWLAVNAARRTFDEPLSDWNRLIPFYIRLRTYTTGTFPQPEEFINAVGRNIAAYMPTGWVHRVMQDRNALILIDGVDELPLKHRTKAKRWIVELIEEFPGNNFVITSRPSAISSSWLEDLDFGQSILQPMGLRDIDRFVAHWHQSNKDTLISADDDDNLVCRPRNS